MAESFSYEQLIASGEGRLFTPDSGRLPLPPMLMFDRITHIDADGGAHGLGRIGHFGFFQARRPGVRERLWPLVLRWLQAGPGVTFHPEPSPAR